MSSAATSARRDDCGKQVAQDCILDCILQADCIGLCAPAPDPSRFEPHREIEQLEFGEFGFPEAKGCVRFNFAVELDLYC